MTDAVLVADYFNKVDDNVYNAMKQAFEDETEPALTLARYINDLPKEVHEAQKRVLGIE